MSTGRLGFLATSSGGSCLRPRHGAPHGFRRRAASSPPRCPSQARTVYRRPSPARKHPGRPVAKASRSSPAPGVFMALPRAPSPSGSGSCSSWARALAAAAPIPAQVGVDLGEVGEQAGLALVVQAQLGWVDRVAALVGATPAQLQAWSRTRRISDSTTSRGMIRCPPETGWGWVWLGSVGSAWRRAQSSRWMTALLVARAPARIPGGPG
jgi:hypothetical protein